MMIIDTRTLIIPAIGGAKIDLDKTTADITNRFRYDQKYDTEAKPYPDNFTIRIDSVSDPYGHKDADPVVQSVFSSSSDVMLYKLVISVLAPATF